MQFRFRRLLLTSGNLFLLLAFSSTPSGGDVLRTERSSPTPGKIQLRERRSSPLDLEIGGNLAGLPAGRVRYLRREDLLALPQETFTVSDDHNFSSPTQVSGVQLEELLRQLSANPQSDLVVAVCDDLYRAHYPQAYLAGHHPVLALLINGKEPKDWPKDSEGFGLDLGPYLISQPAFAPSYEVLGHAEQPQIPWGVVRLEFRDQHAVFAAIQPRGAQAKDAEVQNGYRLAGQNCFRCHNSGAEGGEKAGHPWLVLAAWATAAPDYFTGYVRNPKSRNAHSQMPGNPDYDDTTMRALIAYFRTFAAQANP